MTNGWRVHIDKETGAADVINEAGDAVASYCTPKHASLIAAALEMHAALKGIPQPSEMTEELFWDRLEEWWKGPYLSALRKAEGVES